MLFVLIFHNLTLFYFNFSSNFQIFNSFISNLMCFSKFIFQFQLKFYSIIKKFYIFLFKFFAQFCILILFRNLTFLSSDDDSKWIVSSRNIIFYFYKLIYFKLNFVLFSIKWIYKLFSMKISNRLIWKVCKIYILLYTKVFETATLKIIFI